MKHGLCSYVSKVMKKKNYSRDFGSRIFFKEFFIIALVSNSGGTGPWQRCALSECSYYIVLAKLSLTAPVLLLSISLKKYVKYT